MTVTVTHHQNAQQTAHSEENKPVFVLGVIRVSNEAAKLVGEGRLRFFK
jgi:hypothetical protein